MLMRVQGCFDDFSVEYLAGRVLAQPQVKAQRFKVSHFIIGDYAVVESFLGFLTVGLARLLELLTVA